MEEKLTKTKLVFDKIKGMRMEIGSLFEILDGRVSKLEEIYTEFIQNTKLIKTRDVNAFIFSLDSFYFQNSLLKREYKYLRDYYNITLNRMYGEYYKLFRLINEYVERSLIDNKLSEILRNKKYPRYDDLDDEKEYDFKLTTQLNEDIMNVVNYLINILREKEMALKQYTTNQNFGLNVNNFVSTFNYEVIVLQEQITLYEKYLDFFYHVHEKLLNRLITKISVLEAQLNADIKFEGGLIGTKKDSKVLFEEMSLGNLNKKAAKDLRLSITGQASPFTYDTDTDDSIVEQTTVGEIFDMVSDNIYNMRQLALSDLQLKDDELEIIEAMNEEEKAKTELEEKAKKELEEKAKKELEEKAKKELAEKAKKELEEKAKKELEEKAKKELEEKAKKELAEKAKKELEEKAKKDLDEKAKKELAEKAKKDLDEKAKKELEEKTKKELEEKTKKELEEKAKKELAEKAKKELEEKTKKEVEGTTM